MSDRPETTLLLDPPVRPVDRARPSSLLSQLFPPSVVAREMREPGEPASLLPAEARLAEAFRPKRLAEFAAGRSCARSALGALDVRDVPLLANDDRTARWPDGIVGSITHTLGFCGAVAARSAEVAALGVDAEIVARVARELWPQVFTTQEATWAAALGESEVERFAALTFSAKEAFYKCQFGLTGRWLDFRDVLIEVRPDDSRAGSFSAHPATARARRVMRELVARGRYRFDGALVATGLALSEMEAALAAARASAAGR